MVKELNWTTSESSKAEDTIDPRGATLVFAEGSLNNPEREADASVESVEPLAIPLACENLDFIMTPARLQSILESCNPGCTFVLPQPGERCHHFDSLKSGTTSPNVVLSSQFFRLGLSLPVHPFILEILNFYKVSLM